MIGTSLYEHFAETDQARTMATELARLQRIDHFEAWLRRKDGSLVAVSINARYSRETLTTPALGTPSGIEGLIRDTSYLKRTEAALRQSLSEKDILLKEILHRTNNTLQLIQSFMRVHAAYQPVSQLEDFVARIANRIQAITLVYERLAKGGHLSRINATEYLRDLAAYIQGTSPHKARISLRLDVEDLPLLIDTAVPLGLVVEELVGNAFKHAFAGRQRGQILLSLKRLNHQQLELIISDDGIGLTQHKEGGFGIATAQDIVNQQLKGHLTMCRDQGVSYRITLCDGLYSERVSASSSV